MKILFLSNSMPLVGALREKWIQFIEKHQQFETALTYIYVCSLHFEPSLIKNKKLTLGSVPSM